eukprot:RCo036520
MLGLQIRSAPRPPGNWIAAALAAATSATRSPSTSSASSIRAELSVEAQLRDYLHTQLDPWTVDLDRPAAAQGTCANSGDSCLPPDVPYHHLTALATALLAASYRPSALPHSLRSSPSCHSCSEVSVTPTPWPSFVQVVELPAQEPVASPYLGATAAPERALEPRQNGSVVHCWEPVLFGAPPFPDAIGCLVPVLRTPW